MVKLPDLQVVPLDCASSYTPLLLSSICKYTKSVCGLSLQLPCEVRLLPNALALVLSVILAS